MFRTSSTIRITPGNADTVKSVTINLSKLSVNQKATLEAFRYFKINAFKSVWRPIIRNNADVGTVGTLGSIPAEFPQMVFLFERNPDINYSSYSDIIANNKCKKVGPNRVISMYRKVYPMISVNMGTTSDSSVTVGNGRSFMSTKDIDVTQGLLYHASKYIGVEDVDTTYREVLYEKTDYYYVQLKDIIN